MKKYLFAAVLLSLTQFIYAQRAFTPGNLVTLRIGDGTQIGNSYSALPAFLDEYTISGTLVQSIGLPVQPTGANRRLTVALNDEMAGYLTLSPDGQFLALCGYDAAPGTDSVSKTLATEVNRVVGIVNSKAEINTSSSFKNVFNKVAIRNAIVKDNTIWLTGANGGIFVADVGASTAKLITKVTGRLVSIADEKLFTTSTGKSAEGEEIRVASVGEGLPVTGISNLNNLPGIQSANPSQLFFADLDKSVAGADVLYVVDIAQGITKYSLVKGAWVSNGTPFKAFSYHGITGQIEGGKVTLYLTRKNVGGLNPGNGELVKIVDESGYNGAFTAKPSEPIVKFDKGAHKYLRGVAFVPGSKTVK